MNSIMMYGLEVMGYMAIFLNWLLPMDPKSAQARMESFLSAHYASFVYHSSLPSSLMG